MAKKIFESRRVSDSYVFQGDEKSTGKGLQLLNFLLHIALSSLGNVFSSPCN